MKLLIFSDKAGESFTVKLFNLDFAKLPEDVKKQIEDFSKVKYNMVTGYNEMSTGILDIIIFRGSSTAITTKYP